MTVSSSRLTTLFSAFAFALPVISVLAPKAVVPSLLITAALAGLIAWRSKRRPSLPDLPVAGVLVLLVVWCGIASLWSFNVPSSLLLTGRIAVIFAAGLFLFAVAGELDDATRTQVGLWLVIGVLFALAIMAVERLFDYPLIKLIHEPDWSFRLNRGATAMAMLVWPATAVVWQSRFRKAALILPVLVAVILSFLDSSAAILGLVAGGLTALLAAGRRKAGQIVLIVVTAAILIGAPLAPKQLYALGLHQADWLVESAQRRVEIWSFAAERIVERPIFGWGFDAARHIGDLNIKNEETGRFVMPLHPHNAPLQVLLELGIIGSLILFGLLWLLTARLEKLSPASRISGQAFFMATLAVSCVSYGLWQNQWLATMVSATLLIPLTTGKPSQRVAVHEREPERA